MRSALWTIVVVLCLAPAISYGGTTAANSSPFAALDQPVATESPNPSTVNQGALHFDLGADYGNADFFRGIRQPVNSPAIQGFVDVHFDICKFGDLAVGSYFGYRNGGAEKSHNGAPLTDYLQEGFVGANLQYHAFSLDVGYIEHHSPDGTFASQDEVGARLDYDDADLMKQCHIPLLLHPHVELFREVLDQSAFLSTRSEPAKQNSYLEIGIAPQHRFDIGSSGAWTVNVAMPVTAGMSWDNYYSLTPTAKPNFLGFVSVGAMASVPLPVPAKFGAWELRGGLTYVNDTAQGARQVDHNHADFLTAGVGLEMHY